VVVAFAGADLDFVLPSVNCSESDRFGFGSVFRATADAAIAAALPADEMLSRATSVTGAAFRGQVLLYQLYVGSVLA
jgi:hypothetical protein